jgi:hypothetical protein
LNGENGVAGETGATGATGPQGESGFVTTLGFEMASPTTIGIGISNPPANCTTASYTAGANEFAVLQMGLQATTATANHLLIAPTFSKNGGAATFATTQYAVQNFGPGYGSAHTVASMALQEGASYRFMTAARLLSAGSATDVVCRAVVLIFKKQ